MLVMQNSLTVFSVRLPNKKISQTENWNAWQFIRREAKIIIMGIAVKHTNLKIFTWKHK